MYGLVLEGGGSKGSYQIGAYKAIREEGIEITGVAGTSIGAINGAMIVQGKLDRAYDIWYNITPSRLFNVDEERLKQLKNMEINQGNILYLLRRIKRILNNRGLDVTNIKSIIEKNIDEDVIRKTELDFGIVTVNLSDLKPMELFIEDIPEGKLIDYLMASAYLPAFKMEKMDGKWLIDGGFYDNLPINLLSGRGYREIIAIRTYGMGRVRKIDNEDINITYIAPDEDLGGMLNFDREKVRYNLKLGYYDALKLLKNLKGRKYYIKGEEDKAFYFKFLTNIDRKRVIKIGQILNIESLPYRRVLFEKILPRLARMLGLESECTYEDIVISILERAAENIGLDKFKLYTAGELQEIVKNKYRQKGGNYNSNIPDFILNSDLLSRAVKDEVVDRVIDIIYCREI